MKAEKKLSLRSSARVYRLALLVCMGLCLCLAVRSQQNPPKTGPVYDEAINYLSATHGGLTVGGTIPLTYTPGGEATPAKITNIVSLKLNEEGTAYLPDNFQASVTVRIDYGPSSSSTTPVTQTLTISYDKDAGVAYNPKQYLSFTGAQYVVVTILNVPANTLSNGVPVINLLSVCNEMHIWRDYILSPGGSVTPGLQINTPTATGVPDELPVQWTLPAGTTGHNGLQLEWAWLETELASLYTQNGSLNYDLLFRNNSTRVSLPLGTPGYNIPLYYDGTGNLYCRVRLVNIQYNGTVSEGPWSTVQSFPFTGHNNNLNWQVNTGYAEDGKRKVVIQYFDGTLRQRQTVTKDNSTNTTVSAETYYNGQGRAAIQILPAPGINSVVAYNQQLNLFNSQAPGSDPRASFDLGSGVATTPMDNGSGAAQYYSAGNLEIAQGSNQNIPDAGGYPYTVTRYTPDATGRVMTQSGVGPALKMGSNRETKYFYGAAAQEELDGLFGTDAGDFTHYFKNMVQDANGQSSISYIDMHGRTIATAMAGQPLPGSGILPLDPTSSQYPGQAPTQITRNLLNGNANAVRGSSLESINTLLVPVAGPYTFHYDLTDQAFNPNNTQVCYSCLYDLEIAITDESGAQDPIILKWQGVQVSPAGTCGGAQPTLSASQGTTITPSGNQVDFSQTLQVGSYSIHKTLTVDPAYYQQYQADYLSRVLPDINTLISNEYQALLPTSNCNVTSSTASCQSCQNALGTFTQFKSNYLANYPAGSQPSDATIQTLYNNELANCASLCTNQSHQLADLQSLMLSDMMPGSGQYAQFPILLPIQTTPLSPMVAMYEKYDIFGSYGFNGQPFYLNPENSNSQPDHYYDASGNIVSAPTNPTDFASAFTPSWANSLLPHHPEYAKLQFAQQHLSSAYDFIENMNNVTSWSDPARSNFTDNNGLTENLDPLFAASNDWVDYTNIHNAETTSSYRNNLSIWQFAYAAAICKGTTSASDQQSCLLGVPAQPPYTSLTSAQMDQVWTIYKGLYTSLRNSMLTQYLDLQAPNPDANELAGSSFYKLRFPVTTQQMAAQWWGFNGFPTGNDGSAPTADLNQLATNANNTRCGAYIQAWTDALTNCPVLNGRSDKAAILAEITSGMQTVCEKGLDQSNPDGSSSVAPSTPQDGSPRNFETVIDNVFAAHGLSPQYKDQLCNPFLVTAPGPYGNNPLVTPPPPMGGVDACACSQWAQISQAATTAGYDPTTLSSINTYLSATYGGETITQVILDGLQKCNKIGTQECFPYTHQVTAPCNSNPCSTTETTSSGGQHPPSSDSSCTFSCSGQQCMTITEIPLASPQTRPSFLTCGFTGKPGCISCARIATLTQNYKTWFAGQACAAAPITDNGNLTADQIGYNVVFADYLNYYTGLNLTWTQYFAAASTANCNLSAYASNGSANQTVVCPSTAALTDPAALTVSNDPCDGVHDEAVAIAQQQYQQLQAKALAEFSGYIPYCLSSANEHFTVAYQSSEFHYTLYYYDQSGNLMRTVPPKGARPNFSSAFIASVESARNTPGSSPVQPQHVFVTDYRYNSLNAVVQRNTPDAGTSKFYYDLLGRLVVSQNAQQLADQNYSYTIYDAIGRIQEVGQKPQTSPMNQPTSQDPTALAGWLAGTQPRVQVTYTFYDQPQLDANHNPIDLVHIHPQNLRNRVSFTSTKNSETDASPYMVSYYTYDVHGNVDTLMQDYLGVQGMTNAPYKLVCYDYDLVSGNVNGVDYQPKQGQGDDFYYRYSYDAENRITSVKTSRDSIFWEDDARYFYYKHGPLARTVLGQLSAQGMDYNYTLQGWLKGINIGNGFAGVITDQSGASCPAGSALADADITTRPPTGGVAQYVALNSITFDPGFETYTNDAMETIINSSLAVCTPPSGGNSADASAGGGGTGNVEGFPVALDAYNLSLHYYPGDYTAIGSTTPVADVLQAMPSDAAPLYNGNIAAMALNLPAVGDARVYNYHYDQLNRIGQMDAFSGLNVSNNSFTPVKLNDYQERVSYDPNGNIGTYTRNGFGSSLPMDNLTYNYYPNTNQLSSIHDVAGGSYTTDLKDQGSGNYTYDAIGNLKQDATNGVSNINWTVYGKISSMTNGSGTISYTYDAGGNRMTKTVGSTTTLYVRDPKGRLVSIYAIPSGGSPQQMEVDLYGSSRLGTLGKLTSAPVSVNMGNGLMGWLNTFTRGERSYELTNHLENVLATITDKKIAVPSGTNSSLIDHFTADLVTAQDYYPFGMQMPGRTFALPGVSAYRFGFNGKERDDEVKGAGNEIDYGRRVYDPRVGRFLSVDPMQTSYAYYSPYQYAANRPIEAIDLDGLEPVSNIEKLKIHFEGHNQWNQDVSSVYEPTENRWYTTMSYNDDHQYYWKNNDGSPGTYPGDKLAAKRGYWQHYQTYEQKLQLRLQNDHSFELALLGVMASPFVLMYGIAAAPVVSNLTLQAGASLYPYIPLIGLWGRNVAGFLDESGGVGMQNAALSKEVSFGARQIENFITTEENALWQVEKFKQIITAGAGKEFDRMMKDPIEAVVYNGKTFILDGHNRLKAFSELGKDVKVTLLSFEEAASKYKDKMVDIINGSFKTALKDEH